MFPLTSSPEAVSSIETPGVIPENWKVPSSPVTTLPGSIQSSLKSIPPCQFSRMERCPTHARWSDEGPATSTVTPRAGSPVSVTTTRPDTRVSTSSMISSLRSERTSYVNTVAMERDRWLTVTSNVPVGTAALTEWGERILTRHE